MAWWQNRVSLSSAATTGDDGLASDLRCHQGLRYGHPAAPTTSKMAIQTPPAAEQPCRIGGGWLF